MHWKEREQKASKQFKMIHIQVLQKHISYLYNSFIILHIPYSNYLGDSAKPDALFKNWHYAIILNLQVVIAMILSWSLLLYLLHFGLINNIVIIEKLKSEKIANSSPNNTNTNE